MPPARYASYMICTSPRSGSTLLCKLLAATGRAGNPNSHFHTPSLSRWLESYGLSDVTFPSDQARLAAIFEAARARGTGGTGMFGLRLQRGSFAFFMEQAGNLHPDAASDLDRVEAAFGPTLFIHLTRETKLDQAISRVMAEQTGLWHRAADGTELERLSAPQDPAYDAKAIARHLAELSEMDAAWMDWFDAETIDPLRITYEALAQDPGGTLATVLVELGLDPALAKGINPPVAKLANAMSRDWAGRFRRETAGR